MAIAATSVLDTDYEVLRVIGEGTFGTVHQARHRRTGELVAVKQIKLGSGSWDEACRSTELHALKALRHPFIVRLRELLRSQWDGSLFYIFEFLDSDLCKLVKQNPDGLEERRAALLVRQLFAGLTHMHTHGFFHRDIKPENILLKSARETIRIADLGQARSLRARPPFTDYVGTRWYRAPECLLRDRAYSSPVDVWAAGLIFAELLHGSPVFCGTSTLDQLYKIFAVLGRPIEDWPDFKKLSESLRFRQPNCYGCGIATFLPNASEETAVHLTRVLTLNPYRRPTSRRCLEDDFFAALPPLSLDENAEDGAVTQPVTAAQDASREQAREEAQAVRASTFSPIPPPVGIDDLPKGARIVGDRRRETTITPPRRKVVPPDDLDLDAELDAILADSPRKFGESPPAPPAPSALERVGSETSAASKSWDLGYLPEDLRNVLIEASPDPATAPTPLRSAEENWQRQASR